VRCIDECPLLVLVLLLFHCIPAKRSIACDDEILWRASEINDNVRIQRRCGQPAKSF
jgi:hypothetical protein